MKTLTGYPKMLGTSDEVLQCECCGKSNLKRTIVIQLRDGDEPVYYGSDCASRALHYFEVEATGSRLQNLAATVQLSRDTVVRHEASVTKLEAMRAAGHVRYVIGGKELGADLTMLIEHARQDLQREQTRLHKLMDMGTVLKAI